MIVVYSSEVGVYIYSDQVVTDLAFKRNLTTGNKLFFILAASKRKGKQDKLIQFSKKVSKASRKMTTKNSESPEKQHS